MVDTGSVGATVEFHEAAGLFPMHTAEQFADLLASIKQHGFDKHHPIVMCEGKILDGRNRYRACAELGVTPSHIEYVGNPYDKVWIDNGSRRDIEIGQKMMIRFKLDVASGEWERLQRERLSSADRKRSEAAKTQVKEQPRSVGGMFGSPGPVSQDTAHGNIRCPFCGHRGGNHVCRGEAVSNRARTDLAKRAGGSEATAARVQTVAAHRPDLIDKVADGEMKLADAVREVKRETVRAGLENIGARQLKKIMGIFDVIVIDPPWPIKKIERDERPNQVELDYPTMTEAELLDIKLPAAEHCHVWLWTTHRFLPLAFRMLDNWGLAYVCTFVWHKPGGFQPVGLPQFNCEFALYARRGSPQFLETTAFPTCFSAPRTRHSEKPEDFYALLRRVTAGRRYDMHNRRLIEGFEGGGKEAADELAS